VSDREKSTKTGRKKPPPPPPRRRRDPETARAEILDAAERLLGESPPSAVGLKEVAAAAGVSHALVSHYFGTFAELIESVLMRRIRALRADALGRIADPVVLVDIDAMLDALFGVISDPLYVRLSLWALAAERPSGPASFIFREQGMRIVAEASTERILRARPDLAPGPLRERVERALVIANSAAYGYTVGKGAWMDALGREPSAAFDLSVKRALGEMLRRYVLEGSAPAEGDR
jgi:AcrR family transcriptional regulator